MKLYIIPIKQLYGLPKKLLKSKNNTEPNLTNNALKKYTKVNLTDLEISDCFEEDFFTKVNEVIVELAQHNY